MDDQPTNQAPSNSHANDVLTRNLPLLDECTQSSSSAKPSGPEHCLTAEYSGEAVARRDLSIGAIQAENAPTGSGDRLKAELQQDEQPADSKPFDTKLEQASGKLDQLLGFVNNFEKLKRRSKVKPSRR